MEEEFVQASPESQKRRRQRRWSKPRKKCKWAIDGKESISACSESFCDVKQLPNDTEEKPIDISMLYGNQVSECEQDQEDVDIFAYVKLLEKVSLQAADGPVRHVAKNLCTQQFIAVRDLPKLQEDLDIFKEIEIKNSNPDETQLHVTATQIERLCEAADVIADIKRENIQFSQWEGSNQPPNSVAQAIWDDFNELCSSPQSPKSETAQNKSESYDSPDFSLKTKVLRTYSGHRTQRKQTQKIAQTQKIDQYDSDSKSSLTSELSMQRDEYFDCSPINDNFDLNKSSRVCENLQNLSTFFSQSITQEDANSTTDGVYRYIMKMKAKKKEARLLDWFRSGKNFELTDDLGSSVFEGFHDSEIDSVQSYPSHKSANIMDFLDDDEDVFQEVRTSFLVEETKESDNVQIYSDKDIESVLESADKVLAAASHHFEKMDCNKEGTNIKNISLSNCHSENSEHTLIEEKRIDDFNKPPEHKEYTSASMKYDQNHSHLRKTDLNSNAKFRGLQSASRKAMKLFEEAKQKANSTPTELECWTDDDLLEDFNGLLCEIDNSDRPRPFKETNRTLTVQLKKSEDDQKEQDYSKENYKNTRNRKLGTSNTINKPVKRSCRNEVINEQQLYNKNRDTFKNSIHAYSSEFPSGSGNAISAVTQNAQYAEINAANIESGKIGEKNDALEMLSITCGGFQSASGKPISASQNAFAAVQRIYTEVDSDKDGLKKFIETASIEMPKSKKDHPFVKPSINEQQFYNRNRDAFKITTHENSAGLSSVSGDAISIAQNVQYDKINAATIESAKLGEKNDALELPSITCRGFQSASGKPISASQNAFAAVQRIYAEIDSDKDGLNKFIETASIEMPKSKKDHPFVKPSINEQQFYNRNRDAFKITTHENSAGLSSVSGDAISIAQNVQYDKINAATIESAKLGEKNDALELPSITCRGFQSASGKPISASQNAFAAVQRIYAEIDSDKDGLNKFIETASIEMPKSKKDHPFVKPSINEQQFYNRNRDAFINSTHENSAKLSSVFSDAISIAQNVQYDKINAAIIESAKIDEKNDALEMLSITCGGFQSASGKPISASQNAFAAVQRIYAEIDSDKDGLNKFIETASIEMPKSKKDHPFVKPSINEQQFYNRNRDAFKNTTHENSAELSSVSDDAISIAQNVQYDKINAATIIESAKLGEKNDALEMLPITCGGFQSASGKPISASQNAFAAVQRIYAEVDSDKDGLNKFIESASIEMPKIKKDHPFVKPSMGMVGFQSASGKTISFSQSALSKVNRILADVDNDIEFKNNITGLDTFLETAGMVNLCQNDTSHESSGICKNEDDLTEFNRNSEQIFMVTGNKIENNSIKTDLKSEGFQSVSSKNIQISATTITKKMNDLDDKKKATCFIDVMKNSMRMHHTRLKPLSTKTRDKPCTPVKMKPENSQFNTPDLKEFFESVHTSTPQSVKCKYNLSLTQEISASTAALLEDELQESSVTEDFRKICWDDYEDSLKENKNTPEELSKPLDVVGITKQMKNARAAQRQKQFEIIKSKKSSHFAINSGSLFIKKQNKNRVKWKSIVGDQVPTSYTLQELDRMGCLEDITRINYSNVANFKFDVLRFNVGAASLVYIDLADGVQLIPDDYNKVGFHEIEQAFLTMIGVSLSLIPSNWILHHYKMIFLKLSWLEKSFPTVLLNQLCTPENIILQLKYRYDREIDRTERSVLKKILECDDSSAKRMVLYVVDICQGSSETELELSDGWYTIRTKIDLAMYGLISSEKVGIGTKLMIQNAELCNCEVGCSPLNIPSQVRLKIHTNSTRRAKWNVKLGLYKDPQPFCITLDSVRENGGLVTRLNLTIVRIYPVVYMNKKGNTREIHSEKVEMKLRNQEEKVDFDNFEMIFSQKQKEIEHEARMKRRKLGSIRKFIHNSDDSADLLELAEKGFDLEDIQHDLSHEQQKRFVEFQQEISLRNTEEVRRRVKDHLENQLNKRVSTEILKIRVIDSILPRESAILSIWRPQENLRKMFQEGITFEISNCIPGGIRNGDKQLSSTKTSEYKFSEDKQIISSIRDFFKKITTIEEINSRDFVPTFNEVDTCGLVVMISNVEPRKFQSVFITDFKENIVCINFWNGIKEYSYEDVIKTDRFLVASNLQWRNNSANGDIPCLFVTEFSTFSEKSKTECSTKVLNALKAQFINTNLKDFSMKLTIKIEQLRRNRNSFTTPMRKNVLSLNTSSPTNSSLGKTLCSPSIAGKSAYVPSPQHRIGRLGMYGTPPPISPLAINKCKSSVRKKYQMPLKRTEDVSKNLQS